MSKQEVAVVLDMNEHMMNPELHDLFTETSDVQSVVVSDLDTGDFAIGDVGFERKTWNDYVSSVKDGRFEEQSEKMDGYDHAYVLIEGDMADTDTLVHTDMGGASIRGHMASLTARESYAVDGVVPCSTLALMADYAVRLARKHSEDPSHTYVPTGSVGVDEPTGKQMWGCVDGVGPEMAERIYGHFGGPAHFWEQHKGKRKDALMTVQGIGDLLAEKILDDIDR